MPIVYLGLGSNLENRHKNVEVAISLLEDSPQILLQKQAPLIETKPHGNIDQNNFINTAVEISTDLSPQELLASILNIEKSMGRIRHGKWGPRIIDIDILFYGDQVINEKDLVIPHPELPKRNFVLRSLLELCPNLKHPVLKSSMLELSKSI